MSDLSIVLNRDVSSIDYHFADDVIFGGNLVKNLDKVSDRFDYIITQATEFRPDKVSLEVYGTDIYDWVIMLINGCKREEMVEGAVISIPNRQSLERYLVR